MGVTFQEYQNLGENRNYPLDDNASRLSTDGELLPNSIIADAHVWLPETAGNYIFVSSVTVTANLVTVTLLASDSPIVEPCLPQSSSSSSSGVTGSGFVPLGAVSVDRNSLVLYRNYAIEAQYPGVGGWIAFGSGAEEILFDGKFTGPGASMLLPRLCKSYRTLPVTSIGKVGNSVELTGVVSLLGDDDVRVYSQSRLIGGENTDIIVIDIDPETLTEYTGPCGGRPDSNTCGKTLVETINGVTPNIYGNIRINFYGGFVEGQDVTDSNIVLEFPLGLAEGCFGTDKLPDEDGRLPNEGDDYCESTAVPWIVSDDFYRPPGAGIGFGDDWEVIEGCMNIADIAAGEGAVEAEPCPTSSSSSSAEPFCPSGILIYPPYLEDFTDGTADYFVTFNETNWYVEHDEYRVVTSKTTNSINVCLATSMDTDIETDVRVLILNQQTGAQQNAYLIFGWNPHLMVGTQYWFAGINLTQQTLEIGRVTSAGRIVEFSFYMDPALGLPSLKPRTVYNMVARVTAVTGNNVYIQLAVTGPTFYQPIGITVSDDLFTDGPCGFGVVQSWAAFEMLEQS